MLRPHPGARAVIWVGAPRKERGGKKEKEALRLAAAGPALLEGGNSSAITASGECHRFLQRRRDGRGASCSCSARVAAGSHSPLPF